MSHIDLWGKDTQYFHLLSPENVMEAAEFLNHRLTGRVLTLNSLENRVYDVELAKNIFEDKKFSPDHVIIKFYRPGRWNKLQIEEEHHFLEFLSEFEIPVVAPLRLSGQTLHRHEPTQLWFSFFPKIMGRLKDELNKEETEQIGRLIGRIHNIGQMNSFQHRASLTADQFIQSSIKILKDHPPIEEKSFSYYLELLGPLYQICQRMFQHTKFQRIHGDFHRGNIVWTQDGPVAIDFDDTLMGPIEQDLWLLHPGRDTYSIQDKDRFLKAYLEMTKAQSINHHLSEPLRAMRMVHFNAWIAKRWDDHAFQRTFPQFKTSAYWDMEMLEMRQQLANLQEIGMGFDE
jgi:Ser/Thr protein kinase RdoA (MazF antagonist)